MPVAAVAMIAVGAEVGVTTLVGGLMVASGALSLVGEITGNKTLKTIGAIGGVVAGGIGLVNSLSGASSAASELSAAGSADAPLGGVSPSGFSVGGSDAPLGGLSPSGALGSTSTSDSLINASPSVAGAQDVAGAGDSLIGSVSSPSASTAENIISGDANTVADAGQSTGGITTSNNATTSGDASSRITGDATTDTGLTDTQSRFGSQGQDVQYTDALNKAAAGTNNSGVMSWLKNLTPEEKIQYGKMLQGGLGSIADFMKQKSGASSAQTALTNAQTSLINSRMANANNLTGLKINLPTSPRTNAF